MEFLSSQCCVCLDLTLNAEKVTNCDNKNAQWITKLQNVVPEVEWHDHYTICKSCSTHLDIANEFRALCNRLDNARRKILLPKVEENPAIYKCFHCNAGFLDKDLLSDHVASCPKRQQEAKPRPAKQFKCDNCGKTYTTRPALENHLPTCLASVKGVTCKKRSSFSCEVCGLALRYAKQVVEHCVAEHAMDRKAVKPYTCDECSMRFTSSTNLIQHKKYHSGSRSHVCSFCGKSYITKSDLTVHEYTHFNRRNYKCPVCDKAFNTNKNLCSHKLVVHTDASLWKHCCELCGRRFPLKSGYEQHMRRHAGDKPFACHVCGKPFVSRSELQKHMGFHSKAKPFKCPHCEKAYKERRVCEAHLSKVHGVGDAKLPVRVRKYACDLCPGAFFDRQKLDRHLRTHSGLKPFECRKCDKKFTDNYYLKQHVKNVHQGVEEEGGLELEALVS